MSVLHTNHQFDLEAARCRALFTEKMNDYGTAWRLLRLGSLIDQIYIKAARIRNLEEQQAQMVDDPVDTEYVGIVNYSLMALIQLELGPEDECTLAPSEILGHYDHHLAETKALMQAKNHDYGEIWRLMERSSLTDLILMKILRMKKIVANQGKTIASEGLDANLRDMINYAIFALIKISEADKTTVA